MRLDRKYNRRLQAFDSLLRVRWSTERELWVLERRYRRAQWSIGAVVTDDAAIQLRDGYLELGTYPARELPPVDRLTQYLGWVDTWRYGLRPDQFADKYEQHHEVRAEAKEAKIKRHLRDRASSTWDDVAPLMGSRSYARHTGFR